MSAHELVRQVRENVTVTIVLEDEVTSDDITRLQNVLDLAAYCLDAQFIS
jgi:hypothetical protein